jgi:glycosyltransferase involved in cell wall biosynthesis
MAEKLKVLEICNLDRFAASPYMLPLFKALAEKGNEVHLACTVTSFADPLSKAGITIHDVPISRRISPFQDLNSYRQLKQIIREGNYDVVHTHNPKDGILGRIAAWKRKVPLVLHTCNGYYFSHRSSRLKKWLVLRAEKFASKRCHRIIFVNSEDLALAAARKIVGPGKARLIYNGVDLERFAPGQDTNLRQELGIAPEAKVVGFIGEIRREKNLDVLIRAAGRLIGKYPDLHLVFVGDYSMEPDEPARLNDMAAELGLSGRITFTGYRFDPERFYRIFDIYVLPTTREGFGVTLIEAMASSTPLIACRVRGPKEIISDGAEGILIKDRDPEELFQAIEFLLKNPEAVERYITKARKKVSKEFDQKKILPVLLEQYERRGEGEA